MMKASGDAGAEIAIGMARHDQRALFIAQVTAATLRLSDSNRPYCQFPIYKETATGLDASGQSIPDWAQPR